MNKLLTLLVAGLLASTAFAGSVLELGTTEFNQGPPIFGTVEISTEERFSRLEITSVSSNESGGLIFDGEKDETIILDHVNKHYYVLGKEQIDRMASQLEDAMKQMEEALAKMPPEQRALAEQMMQAQLPVKKAEGPRGTLNKTGETDTIAGLECDYYIVVQGEHLFRQLCVTSWDEFPEGQEVADAMLDLSDFFKSMREAFASYGGLDLMDRQQDMFSYMDEVNGYPILTREFDPTGKLVIETLLKSASHGELDLQLFEPPPGYDQQYFE